MLKPSFPWSLLQTLAYATALPAWCVLLPFLWFMRFKFRAGIFRPHYQVQARRSWPAGPTRAERIYALGQVAFPRQRGAIKLRIAAHELLLDQRESWTQWHT